ncbi:indole-3-acetaldehyde oxidase-like [Lotus japonicus]|uniref:indole-3-acetaldehyde oxidase-like n=1 Tax=Lotus japonicus TaxID=34305 RepID=UPI00258C777B|nr:indole-3-acetaldehyde oxidase-like [Lotus japonicus]
MEQVTEKKTCREWCLVKGGLTAGSTTSESSCEAVRLSCNVLVEMLKPLKEKLHEEMGSIKWETLILQRRWATAGHNGRLHRRWQVEVKVTGGGDGDDGR